MMAVPIDARIVVGVKYYRQDDYFVQNTDDDFYFTRQVTRKYLADHTAWHTMVVYGELYFKGTLHRGRRDFILCPGPSFSSRRRTSASFFLYDVCKKATLRDKESPNEVQAGTRKAHRC
jgi:hypothetical protein